jgi:hypothetical protein
VRALEDDVIGVFAFGSYARGEASPSSDLDLHGVTRVAPAIHYRTWFVDDLHVSVGIRSVDEILKRRRQPADWSLGFATESPATWLWAEDEAVALLGEEPGFPHPPDPPELEDFVEFCGKALRAHDSIALRVAARMAGETAVPLLRDENTRIVVRTRSDAVRAALAFEVAPDGWADDLQAAIGVAPRDDAAVRAAVVRIARGVLRLLRERRSSVGEKQPELTRYLLDGTLERHLDQLY